LDVLRTRWKFVLVTLGLGAVVTALVIILVPPTYGSNATLLISTPSTGVADSYTVSLATSQRAESYSNLAMGSEVLTRVAERLDNEVTATELEDQVELSVVQDTLLLRVDARAKSPELAQQIATVMSDEIIRLVKNLETPSDSDVPAPIIARVAGKASFSTTPVAPNIPINLGIGLLLSLLAGIAGAFVRDSLDTSVKTAEEIEEITENSLLVTLPFDPAVKQNPLSIEDHGGALGEAFRVLRTNLQFSNLDAKRQMLLVSSAVPAEGKTFVATNLAISMAKSGRSVLLIDSDMRNPNVAALLGLENSVGVMTVLLGRSTLEQAIQEHVSGVSFLGTGPQPPNPAEVLDTQAMRDLLATVRAEYDAVIIDAPPILPVADSAILATEVDGTLLLAHHGSTSREQLRQAVARITSVGGRLIGTILNLAPRRSLGLYGYGYGYGYGTPAEPPRSTTTDSTDRRAGRSLSGSGRRVRR
jgi:receptor protein-tyrosine kinase